MTIYHERLIAQLKELDINLSHEPKDSPLLQLAGLISNSYLDQDEQRSVLEQSLKIATEQEALLKQKYEIELNKINTVSYDGILITDVDWMITSLNQRGETILKINMEHCVNTSLSSKLAFLNSQKEHLDLDKLKHHFECGNNYVCQEGVIITLEGRGHEVFASFTIAPFYLKDKLNAYVIIFRDISHELTKECKSTLTNLKNLASIKNKEQIFLTSSQAVLANNHNGAFASELNQYVGNETSLLIEQFMITHAIKSNINSLNHMLENGSQFDNRQNSFLITHKLPELYKGVLELGLPEGVIIENSVNQPILGDSIEFEQLLYEIIALHQITFKSSNITQINIKPLETAISFRPWIIVELKLKTAYTLSSELVQANIEHIKNQLSSPFFDSISINNSQPYENIQIILKFPIMNEDFISASHQTAPLRCLFYLEEHSPLLALMNEGFLLNQLKFYVAKNAEDAVKKIKEERLNKTEFNIIISDKKDFEYLERSVFLEITSYINDQFLGMIYINDHPPSLDNLDINVYSIPTSSSLKELRSVLYSLRAIYLKKSKPIASPLGSLPFYDKKILFIDLEEYSQILYLQLFEELGLSVCLTTGNQFEPKLLLESFDGIVINAHNDMTSLITLLKEIHESDSNIPVCVFVPPLPENDLSQILNYKIEHYLTKPFSISELLIMLEHGFH